MIQTLDSGKQSLYASYFRFTLKFSLWFRRNDHCYTIMAYDAKANSSSDGRRLWEKARKNVATIISKAKEPPSHQCSKCRGFFTEKTLKLHECQQSLPRRKRNLAPLLSATTSKVKITPNSSSSVISNWNQKRLKKLHRSQILKRRNRLYDTRNNGSHKGFGNLKCPLCETHFRRSRTVHCHLSTYHRVSMSCQKALGFDVATVSKNGSSSLTRLKSLADNMKHCIGQILEAAESQKGIRAKFRRVGRSNSFEMDIDP